MKNDVKSDQELLENAQFLPGGVAVGVPSVIRCPRCRRTVLRVPQKSACDCIDCYHRWIELVCSYCEWRGDSNLIKELESQTEKDDIEELTRQSFAPDRNWMQHKDGTVSLCGRRYRVTIKRINEVIDK